jgi:two-component sensor histidine kinase
VLFFFTYFVNAQIDYIIKKEQYTKLDTIPVLIDKNYSFQEILNNDKLQFTKQTTIDVKNVNHYWVKLTLNTNFGYDKTFFFWTSPSFFSELYYINKDENKWKIKKGGEMVANNKTVFRGIPVILKANEPTTLYIKVDVSEVNNSDHLLKPVVTIEAQHLSFEIYRQQYDWWLITVAIVLAFLLYNFYWYVMIREKVYLYYLILLIGGLIYITSIGPFLAFFVTVDRFTTWITEDNIIVGKMSGFLYSLIGAIFVFSGFVQFTRNYLKTNHYFPIWDSYLKKFLIVFIFIQLIFMSNHHFELYQHEDIYDLLNNLWMFAILMQIVIISIKSYRMKTPESSYFLKALFVPTFFLISLVAYIIIMQDNSLVSLLSYLSVLSITITFGIILVAKVNLIKKELSNEKFEKQAIVAQNEIEKERNLRLQEKIEYYKNEVAAAQHIKLLMKELHHRVKNNLQIVSSLLSLQSFRIKDQTAIDAVKEGQHRIEAMSLIHQKLYIQDNITQVNIKEFITDIAESLMEAYGFNKNNFQMEIFVSEEFLDVDKAIPLSIIINELITNAFKYAYKTIDYPELKIYFTKKSNKATLFVSDNGVGIDEDAWKNNDGYGKELVQTFTEQLSGTLTLIVNNGTAFQIEFPC